MRNTLIIILLVTLFTGITAHAQDRILIRGKVTEKGTNETLPGVTVAELDKDNRIVGGTQTDMDGNYSITVRNVAGQKLSFSFLGFQTEEVPIGSRAVINVEMTEGGLALEEMVVTAQKKISTGMLNISEKDMTFAYSKIEARDVEALPVASIDEALQGRMAGVDIVANSGSPGSGMSIRIRGSTSINSSSDPLIVVDGIPFETTISNDFDFSTADEESYSQLLNISPSDIQEITVLKDAAATAMYGSKGANGVLVIKTKRGTVGKPRLQYNFKGGLTVPRNAIPTLNGDQYTTMMLEAFMNAGTPINLAERPEFARDPNNPYYFYNYGQNTDWVKEVRQNGYKHEHNFSLSGGGGKAVYRASVGYLDDTGTIKGAEKYTRFTTKLSLNYNISDRIRVTADLDFTHGETKSPYMKDLLGSTYTKMPNQSVYEYNELGEKTPNYFSPEQTPQGNFLSADVGKREKGIYNPVAMAREGKWSKLDDRIRPNFSLQYIVIPDVLTYMGNVAFDIMSEKGNSFLPQIATGRPWTESTVNRAQDWDNEAFIIQTLNTLQFTPKIGEFASLLVFGQLRTFDKQTEGFSSVTSNTASIYLTDPSNPSRVIAPSSSMTHERNLSSQFLVNLNILERYKITGVLSVDGDSKFGKNYKFGYFPSVSLRWTLSNEKFFKDLTYLNDLSLRASYGVSGKTPDRNYLFYNQYQSYGYTYLDELGVYSSSMKLDNLRWERTGEINFGFNAIAYNNRVNIDFNWYKKKTNDLLFSGVGIPSTTGVGSIYMNVGSMDNKGWELSIMTVPYSSKDWQIDFNMNFSRGQNIIRSLSENVTTTTVPTSANGKFMARMQVGNPLGSFYGYKYAGVYLNEDETIARGANGDKIYTYDANGEKIPVKMKFWYPTNGYEFEAGDAKYVDINNDGNIDYKDIVYLGNANALLHGGFGPRIRYRKWTLDAFFNFRYGFDIVNETKMNMEKMYNFDNQSRAVERRWTHSYESAADAPDNLLPRALYNKGYNWVACDRFVEDGSFLRFKSWTLRYAFDRNLVKKLGMNDLSLSFTMYNIYTWTKYTGMNPEVSVRNVSKDIFSIGYDNSKSPNNMDFSFGLNATF